MRDTDAMLCPLLGLSTVQVAAMRKPHVILVPPNLPVQTHTQLPSCLLIHCFAGVFCCCRPAAVSCPGGAAILIAVMS